MIRFGIIGAGWRSEFYIRIASLLPEVFCVQGIYIRNAKKRDDFSARYDVPIYVSLEELLSTKPDFVVSCVDSYSICKEIENLCNQGVAVLSETPIGVGEDELRWFEGKIQSDWKVQVAEQFHLMPRNQAYKRIIDSGILGEVRQVQLSCCHDYHAASLIRFFLGIRDELPKTITCSMEDITMRYNSREGKQTPEQIIGKQHIAICQYGNKTAIYDFNFEQYFSDIRGSRIVIRGSKGEIVNNECRYLKGDVVMKFELVRNSCGSYENLDGLYLDTITGNGELLYQNPFRKARISDEEIAIAMVLLKMDKYLKTGCEFYSLKDAIVDVKTAIRFTSDEE